MKLSVADAANAAATLMAATIIVSSVFSLGDHHRTAQGGLVGEHVRWSKRDLSAKHYVYFWADGIHVQARLDE